MDPGKFFQVVGDDGRRGHIFKLFKRRYRLDVGRFKFARPSPLPILGVELNNVKT